jgi:hypothetical protein
MRVNALTALNDAANLRESAPADHSVRRAVIGEMAVARLAGMMAATKALVASDTAPTPRASGSQNCTPYSWADPVRTLRDE